MSIDYRSLETVEQLEQVVDLEIAIWGLDPRDATPANLLHALLHGGGCLYGAFAGDQMVGMSMAFPARMHGRWVLWSHMAGVLPSHQGRGIGFALKQRQRDWALAQGLNEIRWTFDPLQRGNAKFNIGQLGALADTYHVNFYGLLKDAINGDLPTDRLEAVWRLDDPRVNARSFASPSQSDGGTVYEGAGALPVLLSADSNGQPVFPQAITTNADAYLIAIPRNLTELRRRDLSLALQWRLALRQVLVGALAAGFIVADFADDAGQSAYIVRKPAL